MAASIEAKTGRRVTLVKGQKGIFEVRVGDRVVARKADGVFPTDEAIVEAVAASLET